MKEIEVKMTVTEITTKLSYKGFRQYITFNKLNNNDLFLIPFENNIFDMRILYINIR